MRKNVNVSNNKNMRCERCAFYKIENNARELNSGNFCELSGKQKNYYNKCNKFQWNSKIMNFGLESDSAPLCKRCGRILKDPESIARGFGDHCYKQRLAALQKRQKRLL